MKKAPIAEIQSIINRKPVMAVSVIEMCPPANGVESKDQAKGSDKHVQWFDSDSKFPNKLNERARLSTTHGQILNVKTNYIVGDGFIFTGAGEEKAKAFAENVNADGETLRDVFEKITADFVRHGNAFLEVVKVNETTFYIYHKDAACCRVGKEPGTILYSRDFDNINKPEFKPVGYTTYPNFRKVASYPSQRCILHIKKYESGYYYYGVPDYKAAYFSGWIDIDFLIPEYNRTRFDNQFRPSGFLAVVGQNLSTSQANEIVENIQRDYSGQSNNSKLIVIAVNDETLVPKYIPFDDAPDGAFTDLQQLANENIILAHGWHPALLIQQPGKLSNGSDIPAAYKLIMSSTIVPNRNILVEAIKKVLVQQMKFALDTMGVVDCNPISYIGQLDPKTVLTADEQRAELGYDPLPEGEVLNDKTKENGID